MMHDPRLGLIFFNRPPLGIWPYSSTVDDITVDSHRQRHRHGTHARSLLDTQKKESSTRYCSCRTKHADAIAIGPTQPTILEIWADCWMKNRSNPPPWTTNHSLGPCPRNIRKSNSNEWKLFPISPKKYVHLSNVNLLLRIIRCLRISHPAPILCRD